MVLFLSFHLPPRKPFVFVQVDHSAPALRLSTQEERRNSRQNGLFAPVT